MLTYLFYFFLLIFVVQLSYYLGIFGKFSFSKPQKITSKRLPVSVIVCAKNQEENVKKFVPLLANQNYPDFEIVLIDDASSDDTLEVFENFEKEYSNIRLVKVKNNEAFWGNKKYALTLGIKAAKKEYLLFTDADCYPTSTEWITAMSSQFTTSKTIVLGYGAYEKVKKSFLNKLIRFEYLMSTIQYFSWAKAGAPYMGVGRNLAFKKDVFFSVNGFIEHIQVRAGHDDLFINQASNKDNTAIAFTPESITLCEPKKTYREWFLHLRRRALTTNHYKTRDKIQLAVFKASQLLFFTTAGVLLALQFQWLIVLPLVFIRYIVAWIIVGFSAGKLAEKDMKLWFPVLELFLIGAHLNIFISNIFSKPLHWK